MRILLTFSIVCNVLFACASWYFVSQYKQARTQFHNTLSLREEDALNHTLEGRTLPLDLSLLPEKSDVEIRLVDALPEGQVSALIVTSLLACSACRERELAAWRELTENDPSLSVIGIVAEDEAVDTRITRIKMENMNLPFPLMIDSEGTFLPFLQTDAHHTPLIVLVHGRTRTIIRAHAPKDGRQDRDERFRHMFLRMGENP